MDRYTCIKIARAVSRGSHWVSKGPKSCDTPYMSNGQWIILIWRWIGTPKARSNNGNSFIFTIFDPQALWQAIANLIQPGEDLQMVVLSSFFAFGVPSDVIVFSLLFLHQKFNPKQCRRLRAIFHRYLSITCLLTFTVCIIRCGGCCTVIDNCVFTLEYSPTILSQTMDYIPAGERALAKNVLINRSRLFTLCKSSTIRKLNPHFGLIIAKKKTKKTQYHDNTCW